MNEEIATWLKKFEAEPVATLHALVLGRTAVAAWTRSSLREIFIEVWQTHREVLDVAITDWLASHIFQPPPERTPEEVWASHLQDVFRGVAGIPLTKADQLFRDQLRDFRSWLRPFRYAESCDPESAFLAALAWATSNRGLDGMWQSLALRKNHEPVYYTDIGLLGLGKIRNDSGKLPAKAPFLLLATLLDLADASMPRDDWELTTRSLLASYHVSEETWLREFAPVLEARQEAKNGSKWLKRILPQLRHEQASAQHVTHDIPPAHTRQEKEAIIAEVLQRGPTAMETKLSSFLNRERAYANSTRNPHFLVRTFNRLAEAAREHDAVWAVARAEEALAWDENNARNWTVLARCLWARGMEARKAHRENDSEADSNEALDTLWTARFRFPSNAYVRTELARLHREAGDFATSEAVYREAVAEFPREAACRNGLAEVLAAEGKFDKAEEVFRHAMQDFPDEATSWSGLANMWNEMGQSEKAEALYREARSKYLQDPYCRKNLAELLLRRSARDRDETQREQARELFQEAAGLGNGYSRWRLETFDSAWRSLVDRPSLQPVQFNENALPASAAASALDKMRPAQRLGRALLLQWQAEKKTGQNERERLFAKAEQLLSLPIAAAGECRWAFIEARGFLLLARNRVPEARTYFEVQLTEAAPRRPLGLRLGLVEARARLGEPLNDNEDAELQSFGALGSIAPLVLKVVRLLEVNESDAALRETLLTLYPRVQELLTMPASEIGEEEFGEAPREQAAVKQETPDKMLAQWLSANVFIPAGVHVRDDLQSAEVLRKARTAARSARVDVLSGIEKLALVA